MLHRSGVELDFGFFLVRQDVDELVAALRAGGERPFGRIGICRDGRVWQRADIGQQRVLRPGPAGQRDGVVDLVLAGKRAEVLPRGLEVAVDEAVPILPRDTGLGDRRIALPILGDAEVRQSAEVGVDVIGGDLDVVGRRPLGRDEAAPAIVGHIVATRDVGILEHAAGRIEKVGLITWLTSSVTRLVWSVPNVLSAL